MKTQNCIVRNKNQLLAAVGCAMDVEVETHIRLLRSDGCVTSYVLDPYQYCNRNGFVSSSSRRRWNKRVRKVRSEIKKIPAKAFS